MPYISRTIRELLDTGVKYPTTVGELNYVITRMLLDYVGTQQSYAAYNELVGVLECAKMEMYRRMTAPYEDSKLAENGDVYPETP